MADLITRLIVNTTDHDAKLKKAQQSLKAYSNTGKSVDTAIKGMTSVVGKFAGAIGVAMTAADAFKKTIESNEVVGDAFRQTQAALNGVIDDFFYKLSTGDFSGFIDGLKDVIQNAKDAYDEIDRLGTLQAFNKRGMAELNQSDSAARAVLRNKKATEEQKAAARKQIAENNEARRKMANEEVKQSNAAYNALIRQISKETGVPVKVIDQAARNASSWFSATEGVKGFKERNQGNYYSLSQEGKNKWDYGEKLATQEAQILKANEYVIQGINAKQSYTDRLAANNRLVGSGTTTGTKKTTKSTSDTTAVETGVDILNLQDLYNQMKKIAQLKVEMMDHDTNEDSLLGVDYDRELRELEAVRNKMAEVNEEALEKERQKKEAYEKTNDAIYTMGSAISSIGSNVGLPALNVAGTMAQAIANIMLGYAKASAESSKMSPIGWAAFTLSGLAEVTSVIAQMKSIGTYAEGGIAYGPTLGIFGEYAGASHNPEVVAPLSKLQNILGEGEGSQTVTLKLDGRDMVAVLNKNLRQISRNG